MSEVIDFNMAKLKETDAVCRLVDHIRMLKRQNNELEDALRKMNNDRLGYVQGYQDGLRDAVDKIAAQTTLSNLLNVYKEMIISQLERLSRQTREVDYPVGDGHDLSVNEKGDPF